MNSLTCHRFPRSWGFLFIALALAFCLPSPALAQGSNAVRAKLERTDRILQEAHEVVRQAVGDRPLSLLREARDLQQSAWDDFRAGQFRSASARCGQARLIAVRAAELAKSELRILDQVRQMLTENQDLIDRARDALLQSPNPAAQRLLEAGLSELERGQRAFGDQEFRQAVRFSMFGRDLLQRAMRAAAGEVGANVDRVRDEIAQTDEFLSEARLAVDDDEEAKRHLDEATRVQDEARALFADERVRQARRLTLRARERVLTILRERGSTSDLSLDDMIDRVSDRHRDLRERALHADDAVIEQWLDDANKHLREARDAATANRRKGALANVQLASNLLNRVAERLR